MKENYYYELIGYTDYYLLKDNFDLYWVYSFKNFNKYPFGFRIEPKRNKKGEWYYRLSNDMGNYVKVTVDKLIEIASNPKTRIYPSNQPPRPNRRRNMIIGGYNFNYNETPIIKERNKINSKKNKIEPFELIGYDKPLFKNLLQK